MRAAPTVGLGLLVLGLLNIHVVKYECERAESRFNLADEAKAMLRSQWPQWVSLQKGNGTAS